MNTTRFDRILGKYLVGDANLMCMEIAQQMSNNAESSTAMSGDTPPGKDSRIFFSGRPHVPCFDSGDQLDRNIRQLAKQTSAPPKAEVGLDLNEPRVNSNMLRECQDLWKYLAYDQAPSTGMDTSASTAPSGQDEFASDSDVEDFNATAEFLANKRAKGFLKSDAASDLSNYAPLHTVAEHFLKRRRVDTGMPSPLPNQASVRAQLAYHLAKRRRKHTDNDDASSIVRYFDPEFKQHVHHRRVNFTDKTAQPLDMSAPFIPVEPYLDNEADDDEAQTDNQRLEALVTTETKRFNEALRTAPTNVSLWIKYMAAQEREGAFVRNKHKQRSVVLEKQYSILEKAKAANPTSVELQQITWLMALTVPDELPHKLEQHLHVAPDSELLWLLLIQQTQEQFSAFSLPKMRNLYARVIQTLQASTADVSATLLLFFTLLCTLEAKSGYTERAVGLMQALMEFNCNMPSSLCSTHVEFDQRKKDFQVFWDQDLPRFGEAGHVAWASWQNQSELKSTVPTVDPSYASQLLPSMHSYMTMLETHVEDEVAAMQPPLHLKEVDPARHRGPDDKASDTLNPQGHGVHHHESHDTREEGDEYVWSNLHGYRIPIQDAQDTAEYERILHELKSNRPVAPVQKKAKNDATMALIADHDERLGAHVVPNNDPHVQLLKEESLLHATQWSPLHPRNPDHAPLIEAQPDRVLLFDEIQPFLFHVPAVWHRELLLSHLGLVGVNVRGRLSLQALQWLYQDDVASNSIVATCFRTFQGHSPPPCDRLALLHTVLHDSLTVSRDTLHDPSKVMHVRHLLWQMREHALLMEFETHLALHLNSPDAPRALAKSLLATAPTDMALWEQYAAMEWRLQNVKQVVRICDKTIESLPSTSLEQHRFLFLRFRAELMDATVLWTSRAVWRCVYLVAKAFYPEYVPWKRLEATAHAMLSQECE
ncbi:hypothetical protein DYB32_000975 [Aphanomyces invadans]|uniref:Uncharacterized protein n=1 Tax=Aphanomyces invadans TaxID=157072 RepID=A0A3R6W3J1_9STRA|nr:hypothetical protein DYB32_000975 [Aphanomyces invadans]